MRSSMTSIAISASALFLIAGTASAQPVLITAPKTIGASDTTITPTAGGAAIALLTAEITVRGTTLVVNGRQSIQSLVVERAGAAPGTPGIVTHTPGFTFDYSGGAGTDVVNGAYLIVSGNVTIQGVSGPDVASAIDVSEDGFASAQGPGYPGGSSLNGGSAGGGHGGLGGKGSGVSSQASGAGYGNALAPVMFGSSGGANSSNGLGISGGGPGGGSIRLSVGGTLTLGGAIRASGGNGIASWWDSGGGAGGSVFITSNIVTGAGQITANGGNSSSNYGVITGGGGGGRIAINSANTAGYTGLIVANGGIGGARGGAGTVARIQGGIVNYTIANDTLTPTATLLSIDSPANNVTVRDGGVVQIVGSSSAATINVLDTSELRVVTPLTAGTITVLTGGKIGSNGPLVPIDVTCTTLSLAAGATVDANGFGHPSSQGPGAGGLSNGDGGGGGHSGFGGQGVIVNSGLGAQGLSYGIADQPSSPGSGGGASSSNGLGTAGGGAGGGVVRIRVTNATLNGTITANGLNGTTSFYDSGGGSGGSIWISGTNITGTSTIRARGGNGATTYSVRGAGGGSGGRVAIVSTSTSTFAPTFDVSGGVGTLAGGAGSVYTRVSNVAVPQLTFTGTTAFPANTPLSNQPSANVTIASGARMIPATSAISVLNLNVESGGVFTTLALAPINVTCTNLNVSAGGLVVADGLGFASSQGPGAGGLSSSDGGGAGHGGFGGQGTIVVGFSLGEAGAAYGNIEAPITLGSGGGASSQNGLLTVGGGSGGGVIRFNATSAVIDGIISANGNNGTTSYYDSGGGSGGSIWVTANTVSGAGVVRALGGEASRVYSVNGAGGGSGGRVALVVNNSSNFTGTLNASGGRGTTSGGAGSIFTRTGEAQGQILYTTTLANAAVTPLQSSIHEVTIGSGARASTNNGPVSINKLNVRGGGSVSTTQLVPIDITVATNLVIDTGASINLNGFGHPSTLGPSGGARTSGSGAGGGFGGGGARGGVNPSLATAAYGSADSPFDFGSGGGASSTNGTGFIGGGSGGGALRVNVAGVLTVNGTISANGANGITSWWDSGGGSGGGISLNAGTINGSGLIDARGGNGGQTYSPPGGGGGGGRIALFSCDQSFPIGNINVAGGGTGVTAGGVGSVYFGASSITISDQPDPLGFVVGQPWSLSVVATTSLPNSPLTYQWRRRNDSGVYIAIEEGFDNRYFNTQTPSLEVTSGRCVQEAFYDCVITDACGSFPSNPTFVNVASPVPCPCPADFDQSGGIDGFDVGAFFEAFEAGASEADLDESGGIDGFDIGSFFRSFEGGC